MNRIIDIETIKRAQEGSAKDFETIYNHYSSKLFRYIFYKVRTRQDAEDVTSETWVNIVKNLKTYSFNSSFSTWIYSVTKNILAQYYKSLYDKSADTFEDWMEDSKALKDRNGNFDLEIEKIFEEDEKNIFEDEDQLKDKKEKENKIVEVFKLLKPIQSKLLELRFLKGYKIKEAAEELKISVSNAKVMQMRALDKIKKIYEGRNKSKKP